MKQVVILKNKFCKSSVVKLIGKNRQKTYFEFCHLCLILVLLFTYLLMKAHFIKLFNYNRFANDLILKAIIDRQVPQKALQLFAHLLTAEQVWFDRCHNLPPKYANAWFDYTIEECVQLVPECHDQWIIYLNQLTDADLNKIIKYQNFRGDNWEDSLADILTHVINHGTHTRAQVGQQLKFAGAESLPITDYTYYLRSVVNKI